MSDYDFWVCDECRLHYPSNVEQATVKVQQQSERIYGTDTMHRPVEQLVVCPRCLEKYRNPDRMKR